MAELERILKNRTTDITIGGADDYNVFKHDGGVEQFTAGVSTGNLVTNTVTDAISQKITGIDNTPVPDVNGGTVTSNVGVSSGFDLAFITKIPNDPTVDTGELYKSTFGVITSIRLVIDIGSEKTLNGFRYINYSQVSGSFASRGIKTCKIYVAPSTYTPSTTYNDLTGLTAAVFEGDLLIATTDQVENDLSITETVSQYIIIDIADNHGNSSNIGLRSFWGLSVGVVYDMEIGDTNNRNITVGSTSTANVNFNGVAEGNFTGQSFESGELIGAGIGQIKKPTPTRKFAEYSLITDSDFVSGTAITANIGTNAGLIRGSGSVVSDTTVIYAAFDADTIDYYKSTPEVDESLQLTTGNAVVVIGSRSLDTMQPQKNWKVCTFMRSVAFTAGATEEFILGKVGTTVANGTYLSVSNGFLNVRIGGELAASAVFDMTQFDTDNVMIYFASRQNSSGDWLVDVNINNQTVLDGVTYTGTTTVDLDVIFNSRWGVNTQVSPTTDAIAAGSATTVNLMVINGHTRHSELGDAFTDYTPHEAFFNNPYLFDHHVGVGSSSMDVFWGGPYFEKMRPQKVWFTNLAISGDNFYHGSPTGMPLPSWVPDDGSRFSRTSRNITKACSMGANKTIIGYASNGVNAGFTLGHQPWNEAVYVYKRYHRECVRYGVTMFLMSFHPRNTVPTEMKEVAEGMIQRFTFGLNTYDQMAATDGTIYSLYNLDGTHFTPEAYDIICTEVFNSLIDISGI